MRIINKIKEKILDIINVRYCPFVPDNCPFSQKCDKRIMFTDKCKECPWRNSDRPKERYNGEVM